MSAPCSPHSLPSRLPSTRRAASASSSPTREIPAATGAGDDVSTFLPVELARQLKEDLDRQNVGSIYVPHQVVWAIGIGGALVSAVVTLSPWTFCVMRNVRDHPFDPAQALRERAASLPSPLTARSAFPPRRRRSASPSPTTTTTVVRTPRRQDSASSSSSQSFDSGVAGLHSILHAPATLAGRIKPQRHVSFYLSEDQESAASLSDGDSNDQLLAEDPVGGETADRRVEIEERLAVDHQEKKHAAWRRKWCPLCSRLRRKASSPPPLPGRADVLSPVESPSLGLPRRVSRPRS